jgi:hypothetical protein
VLSREETLEDEAERQRIDRRDVTSDGDVVGVPPEVTDLDLALEPWKKLRPSLI